MKQKVVVKVSMNGHKSRSKALKIAVGFSGVESAALQGQDKNQIEVTGDGVDAVALTTSLRKNVGFAELVSVAPVGEKKEGGGGGGGGDKKNEATVPGPTVWSGYPYGAPLYVCEGRDYDPVCAIM